MNNAYLYICNCFARKSATTLMALALSRTLEEKCNLARRCAIHCIAHVFFPLPLCQLLLLWRKMAFANHTCSKCFLDRKVTFMSMTSACRIRDKFESRSQGVDNWRPLMGLASRPRFRKKASSASVHFRAVNGREASFTATRK